MDDRSLAIGPTVPPSLEVGGAPEEASEAVIAPTTGAPQRARSLAARVRVVARAAGGLVVLGMFVLALKLLSASAAAVAAVLRELQVEGVVNFVGFGWLLAYGALSGSPVAALSLSLLDGGAVSARESLAMLAGSRLGASMIVLVVGLASAMLGRRRPDGIHIGVVALLTTAAIYIPATVLGVWLLDAGVLDGPARAIPTGWTEAPTALVNPAVREIDARLPGALVFALGIGTLLGAFALFDRLLPNLDPPSPRIERLSARFAEPRSMFLLGALITSVTMSVSLSVTILVPLALKGLVSRRHVVPYVMGANITTFLDTLFAALLVDARSAPAVVLAEMLGVTIVSVLVLVFAYGPFSRGILRVAHEASTHPRWLGAFLGVFVATPVALVLV
jgi:sodium-dependent phosphate cotransporter